jgi:pimeloyl-[acyl-carrier protein] synthase
MSSQSPHDAGPVTLSALVNGYKDPHGLYDTLRARDRVTYDPAGRCWLVTGHEAVRALLSDERLVSDVSLAVPQRPTRRSFISDAVQRQIIFMDGPVQARAQRAVLVELSRRSDELLEPLRASAYALAARARDRGEMDLVKDFATPFSMEAISLILGLEVAGTAEMERLEKWSTTYANVTSGYLNVELDDITRLGEYMRAQVQRRAGTPSDDLIGAFMRDGGFEDPEDVVINSMMAFAAGRVTTQKLLGNGLPLLLPEWESWRGMVRANPSATRRLADELLRLVTPTRYVVRFATTEAGVAPGVTIRRGEKVVLFLQAANRDPEAFTGPHTLEGSRQPNAHVAFGFGPHRCPGASIARIEVQTALQALLDTVQKLRPHPSRAPTWEPNPNIGGYASFPCQLA